MSRRVSKHHVRPKSRNGHDGKENIVLIPDTDHRLYHQLFGNMTPDEAMAHIFWHYTTPEWRNEHKEITG